MALADQLAARQITCNITLQFPANNYFGDYFRATPNPFGWRLQLGEYHGRFAGHPVDFYGYWIYLPNQNKCWQAVNAGWAGFAYWNEDGRAAGNPEDWELFSFEVVDSANSLVRIFNSNTKAYVGLEQNTFFCRYDRGHAADFIVSQA